MVAVVYNWKGLKEENYLYTDKEMEKFDPELFAVCFEYKDTKEWFESTFGTGNKTIEGFYIEDDDKKTLSDFLNGEYNTDIEEMKENNPDIDYSDWYWENVEANDLYGIPTNTMKNALKRLKIA